MPRAGLSAVVLAALVLAGCGTTDPLLPRSWVPVDRSPSPESRELLIEFEHGGCYNGSLERIEVDERRTAS